MDRFAKDPSLKKFSPYHLKSSRLVSYPKLISNLCFLIMLKNTVGRGEIAQF